MLANEGLIEAVTDTVTRLKLPAVVLDPVMVAKGGDHLLEPSAVAALRTRLLPIASVLTPNIPEAEALTGLTITSAKDQREAAARLVALGARVVIVKGGHLPGRAVDVWHDGSRFVELEAERIDTPHTHGTGCTFSSAIAACLALGRDSEDAAHTAKAYVTGAIARAPGLGHGHGPLHHFWMQHNHR